MSRRIFFFLWLSQERHPRAASRALHLEPLTPRQTEAKMDQSNLSAYELERLENMRRNAAHLASLGLDDASSAPARSRGGASSRKRPAAPRPLPTAQAVRRSSRQRVAVTPYTDATPLPDARPRVHTRRHAVCLGGARAQAEGWPYRPRARVDQGRRM